MVVEFQSEVGVVARAHDLVQLLPRTNADNLTWQLLRHRLGEVDDPDRRYLRHEDLASLHALERLQDEVDALIQRNLEPGHARVRDERVQAAVRQRVLGLFERRGMLSRETVGVMQGWGHRAGFSVHAGERVAAQDSAGRERLLRYRSLVRFWVGNPALRFGTRGAA